MKILLPYNKTKKRKAVSKSKIYLFDVGVANYLAGRNEILFRSESFGKAFEHFLIQEKMLSGLSALQQEKKIKHYYLISRDPIARNIKGIKILHYQDFLKALWNDKILV